MPSEKETPSHAPDRKTVYKTADGIHLDLHVFEPRPDAAPPPRAALVFFFGGGWIDGSPEQFYPQCAALARRGVAAFSAEYRVASRHHTTPVEAVRDAKSAVRWLRAHAAELNIDPDRIAAGGGSAGGHIAAAAGSVPGLEEPGESTRISSRPDALVLFNPVLDQGPGGYGHDRVQPYWRDISPRHHLGPRTPPTLILSGGRDALVPVAMLEDCQRDITRHGIVCELDITPEGEHGFFNYGRSDAYAHTTHCMLTFLERLGWMPPA
jgi:acetyl esterase/lipase